MSQVATSANSTTDLVSLRPPLPCVVPGHGAGFIEALGMDTMLLQLVDAAPPEIGTSFQLSVFVSSSNTYLLRAISQGPVSIERDGAQAVVLQLRIDASDKLRFTDLLTLVRKDQHIVICETMDVEATDRYTGFSDLHLIPMALPDLAWSELETRRSFLGQVFERPFLITGMTGGLKRGAEINRRLAAVAAHFKIPMGIGSQRVALENPEHAAIFSVKKSSPDVFLIGNIGISQLGRGIDRDACLRAIEMIGADALAIHINILQEVIQVEGDRDFRGLLDALTRIASDLPVPIMVKEVGGGIDPATATRLVQAGIAAIDVGGKGGTSWSYIEGVRAQSPVNRAVADTFRNWGIPTAVAVRALRELNPTIELVATGGLRDGLAVAKALALGATMAGIGLPLFRAALKSEQAPFEVLETFDRGLKTAMICAGAKNLAALGARLHVSPAFTAMLARLRPNL